MSSKKEQYITELFAPESKLKTEIREKMKRENVEGVHLSPMESSILKTLIGLVKAKKVVEVGLLHGYSALWIAEAIGEDGHLYSLEKDPHRFQIAEENLSKSPYRNKITSLLGDATETLESLNSKGPFDAIFIDANKGGYCKYLDWAENNIRKGGLIIGDNSLLFGYLYGEGDPKIKVGSGPQKVMSEFNQRLADPKRYQSCLVPTGSGMTVAIKLF